MQCPGVIISYGYVPWCSFGLLLQWQHNPFTFIIMFSLTKVIKDADKVTANLSVVK